MHAKSANLWMTVVTVILKCYGSCACAKCKEGIEVGLSVLHCAFLAGAETSPKHTHFVLEIASARVT